MLWLRVMLLPCLYLLPVPENLTISSYEMAHVSSKRPSIEYHLGRYPDTSEPIQSHANIERPSYNKQ